MFRRTDRAPKMHPMAKKAMRSRQEIAKDVAAIMDRGFDINQASRELGITVADIQVALKFMQL